MKILNHLKVSHGLSLLILAHTPKRYGASPLSVNDLFGSKMLSNFADSIFAKGRSRSGPNVRYLKQLKSRRHQRKYDENNTFTMHLQKIPGVQPAPPKTFRAKQLNSPPPYQGGVAAALGGRGGSSSSLVTHHSSLTALPFLGFTHTGTEPERDHIGWYGTRFDPTRVEKLYKAHVLHSEGKSQRQIAQTLGLSLTTVNRYISQTKAYADPADASCQNRRR
ncbi:MAG: sigma-70 region 4 domain-containing protein [Acidobacteria bacterium]|nr:sigma-70 region 4 domain-containing protein [Acidobacteriota bacterium]